MLLITHFLLRNRLPRGREWRQLAVYGLLTNSTYLGLYVLAMQRVSPGLGTLSVATNPIFINLFTVLFLRQRLKMTSVASLLLCMTGVVIAAWPLFKNSSASPAGLLILLTGMLAYSIGIFYFSRMQWNDLHLMTINGWQTLMGGVFLLPLAALMYKSSKNDWGLTSLGAIGWLAIMVSIIAVQLWLRLLKEDAVKASYWLFLCPVFGFTISNILTHEPLTLYTLAGMLLVMGGLYWQNARN
jgi:drug/metabolite transporter (DMT)-like permease